MAEFLNKPEVGTMLAGFPPPKLKGNSGFAAMGKPVPFYRQQAGYEHARQMGCSEDEAFAVVNAMSLPLEKDQPYDAMEAGMKYLDLTGTYRLLAVLLTAEKG